MTTAKKKPVASESDNKITEVKPTEQKPKCGLVMPISTTDGCSETHWEEVKNIIREALDDNFDVSLVSESDSVCVIQEKIITNLYSCDIVVCDISALNPNVMFELGIRMAFGKPFVIVKDRATRFIFDIGGIQHVEYPRDLRYASINEFKSLLSKKVLSTYSESLKDDYKSILDSFSIDKVAKISERDVGVGDVILDEIRSIKKEMLSTRRDGGNAYPSTRSVFKKATHFAEAFRSNAERYDTSHGIKNKLIDVALNLRTALPEGMIEDFLSGDEKIYSFVVSSINDPVISNLISLGEITPDTLRDYVRSYCF